MVIDVPISKYIVDLLKLKLKNVMYFMKKKITILYQKSSVYSSE